MSFAQQIYKEFLLQQILPELFFVLPVSFELTPVQILSLLPLPVGLREQLSTGGETRTPRTSDPKSDDFTNLPTPAGAEDSGPDPQTRPRPNALAVRAYPGRFIFYRGTGKSRTCLVAFAELQLNRSPTVPFAQAVGIEPTRQGFGGPPVTLTVTCMCGKRRTRPPAQLSQTPSFQD